MSQGRKPKIKYRCPTCFSKEVDVDLLIDKEKNEYYCIKCCFVGKEQEILDAYQRNKRKYKLITTRLNRWD